MSESDKQLRDALSGAFDKVHAPEQLKMRTVEMIEAKRRGIFGVDRKALFPELRKEQRVISCGILVRY